MCNGIYTFYMATIIKQFFSLFFFFSLDVIHKMPTRFRCLAMKMCAAIFKLRIKRRVSGEERGYKKKELYKANVKQHQKPFLWSCCLFVRDEQLSCQMGYFMVVFRKHKNNFFFCCVISLSLTFFSTSTTNIQNPGNFAIISAHDGCFFFLSFFKLLSFIHEKNNTRRLRQVHRKRKKKKNFDRGHKNVFYFWWTCGHKAIAILAAFPS